MFFNDLIQRKLLSLLQPWLKDEIELNVKLGFLNSHVKLNNLSFNTSALNELLDDPIRLCFKQVTVQRLSFHLSNWSATAFDFQFHGLRIVLSVGEEEEDGIWRRPKPRDLSIEEQKKILAELDPEVLDYFFDYFGGEKAFMHWIVKYDGNLCYSFYHSMMREEIGENGQ